MLVQHLFKLPALQQQSRRDRCCESIHALASALKRLPKSVSNIKLVLFVTCRDALSAERFATAIEILRLQDAHNINLSVKLTFTHTDEKDDQTAALAAAIKKLPDNLINLSLRLRQRIVSPKAAEYLSAAYKKFPQLQSGGCCVSAQK